MADAGSAPATPDPYAVADAQARANTDAAHLNTQLNRPDQITPWGTLSWSQKTGERKFDTDGYNRAMQNWIAYKAIQPNAANGGGTGTPDQTGGGTGGSAGGPAGGGPSGDGAASAPNRLPENGQVPVDAQGRAADGGTADTDPMGRPRKRDFWERPPTGEWTSTLEMSPEIKALFDAGNKNQLEIQGILDAVTSQGKDTLGKGIDYAALPAGGNPNQLLKQATGIPEVDEAQRQKIEDALYGRMTSRLDPKFAEEEAAMRSNLMNRGLVEGSEAWKTQMDAFARSKNDAYSAATNDAISGSGAEMQRYFGMGMDAHKQSMTDIMTKYGMLEGDRATALGEQRTERNDILNEMNGLKSGTQVNMPGFGNASSGTTVQPTNTAQNIWQAFQGQLGAHNGEVAAANGTNAAGAGMIATIAAAFI